MHLRKHKDGDIEFISASDIFNGMNEFDPKVQEMYAFLFLNERELNYFNKNRTNASGNPDLAHIRGMISGYCLAKGWVIQDTPDFRYIKSGSRNKFIIEKPKIPQEELDNRKSLGIIK